MTDAVKLIYKYVDRVIQKLITKYHIDIKYNILVKSRNTVFEGFVLDE